MPTVVDEPTIVQELSRFFMEDSRTYANENKNQPRKYRAARR